MSRDRFADAITVEEVVARYKESQKLVEPIAEEPLERDDFAEASQNAIEEFHKKGDTSNEWNINKGVNLSKDEDPHPINLSKKGEASVRKNRMQNIVFLLIVLCLVPISILAGIYYFDDKKYLFISILIAIYSMVPFFVFFEKGEKKARKIVLIAGITALSVMGREVFFMFPSIKPMAAFAIIAGMSLGIESGFMVGALSMLLSNMLFGQGPWTPWQMFAMGLIGLVAGVFGKMGFAMKKRLCLGILGFLLPVIFYGGIMNPASLVMMSYQITPQNLFAIFMSGLPTDLVHAATTMVLLLLAGPAMLEKLERIKIKYGI